MTEQKCAKIVAGKGLRSSEAPNFYIELPTTVFVVCRNFPFEETENVVVFVSEDDAFEFIKKQTKDGYNYYIEKLELKW